MCRTLQVRSSFHALQVTFHAQLNSRAADVLRQEFLELHGQLGSL